MRSVWKWGAAAVAVYLALGFLLVDGLRIRPIYDGLAPPPPYNYVNPPEDLEETNAEPLPGTSRISFDEAGSIGRTVSTGDGQALVVFPPEGIAPVEGVDEVRVRVEPLDTSDFPGPPEEGIVISGNAYRVAATYTGTEEEVELVRDITIVLRYPVHAETVLRHEGDGWQALETDIAQASSQLFADSDELGVFVTAGPPVEEGRGWVPFVAGGLGVVAAVAGYVIGRRRSSR